VPGYAELVAGADRYDIDGITVVVASSTQLIAMKQTRDSEQDRADIAALRDAGAL
jgi:hypothetical protein